ncbi:hypothetical protein [Pseudomonas sp.]|uniref:hypothetical protein n=1 Tax=Pseudomonas sp. TaxID=306 RepID=UPI002587187C|nr:hypothetical protein [Pseudomonas sp.]
MADELNIPLDPEKLRSIGAKLRSRFAAYDTARRDVEEQWTKNLRQFVGKYDPHIETYLKPEQSRAYPRITRVKVLSMVARLHALLFPAGEANWGIEASPVPSLPSDKLVDVLNKWMEENPQAQATQEELDRLVKVEADNIAKKMQAVITDQLADAAEHGSVDYQQMVREVLFHGTLYSCGVLKGPMTVSDVTSSLVLDDAGMPQVVETTTYRPYYEVVSPWDYYPDYSAKNFRQQDGEFQRHVYSRHAVKKLAERDDYMKDQVKRYLREHPKGNYQKKTYETELDTLSVSQRRTQPAEHDKFELIEYWGSLSGHDLRGCGVEVSDDDLDKDLYACVWMIDDVVIKAAQAPYTKDVPMYHQFVFEHDEVNLTGSGLPAIMRDSQLGVSSFTRMLVDNASSVCGPSIELDLEQLAANSAKTVGPFQVFTKDNPSPNGARAVQDVSFNSHMGDLLSAIRLMREFSDSETFVNPMTGGDFENAPSEALRTNGNMSMALNTAALPFKDIVRSFDRFTKSVVYSTMEWNLVYNERREELRGDLRPIPKGASSLLAKETRAVALDQLAGTLTPEERVYINEEELLKERLQSRDLPLDRLMASPEEVQRRRERAAQAAEKQQQQADQMFAANMRTLQTEALKDAAQAQKNMDTGDTLVLKALLEAIAKGADLDELGRIAGNRRSGTQEGADQQQPPAQPAG